MAEKAEIAILVRMRDEASRVMGGMANNIERHAGTIRKAGLVMGAAGAALTVGLLSAVKSTLAEERGIARLDVVLKKVGSSYEKVSDVLEKQIRQTQLTTSFGDELQRELLGKLIPTFGNYEDAVKAVPLVLDAMAQSGRSADSVVSGLGRALAGQVNTAISVGIQFDKTMNTLERFALVESKIGGAAAAMVDPFEQVKNALGDLAQAVAAPLVGPLTKFLGKMAEIALKLSEVNPGIATFGAIAASAAGVILTLGGAVAIILPSLVQRVRLLESIAAVQAVVTALTGPMGIAIAAAAIGVGFATAAAVKNFQSGGVVPGPIGQPQLAVVHGGERITPVGGRTSGGTGGVVVNFQQPVFMNDERSMMQLANLITEAQRRRSRGTVGRLP